MSKIMIRSRMEMVGFGNLVDRTRASDGVEKRIMFPMNQGGDGMEAVVTRKRFLRHGLIATAAAFAGKSVFAQSPVASPVVPDRGPPIDGALVKQFVIAGHGQLEKVKEMLAAQPALINATWDWGGGDFETALGGASHMGRADIARFLLENNARMDLFAAAMLGRLDIIKAAAAAFPNIVHVPGPHKIPLLAHAEKGGADAMAVVEFLRTLAS